MNDTLIHGISMRHCKLPQLFAYMNSARQNCGNYNYVKVSVP